MAPYVEMLMGHGPPPTGPMIARGVRPSLSIDVVSSVPGEMFTQMRTALVQERILAFTETPDTAFAPTLTHRTCSSSRRSTARGHARSTTRSARSHPASRPTSSCSDVNAINVAPMVDPVATVVICADTSNVDTVFVAGRIVKHNGQLVDADLDRTSRSSTSRGITSSVKAGSCRTGGPPSRRPW